MNDYEALILLMYIHDSLKTIFWTARLNGSIIKVFFPMELLMGFN